MDKYFTDGHEVDDDFKTIADALHEVGFSNCSWKNDVCPSFTNDRVVVYVDRANASDREWTDLRRYSVIQINENRTCLDSDSLSAVISAVRSK